MKRLYLQLATSLIVSIFLVFSVLPVYGLSLDQKRIIDSGAHYFNVEATAHQTCGISGSTPLIGGDNIEKAWNHLSTKGLEPHQIGGIIGNLLGESGLIPNRKQGGGMQTISSFSEVRANIGYGIAQWTTAGRQNAWGDFARESGRDPLSLDLQLDFLIHEMEANPTFYGYNHLKQSGDLRQATWIFLAFFERPSAVVNAGKAGNPNQPTSGSAKTALDDRVALAEPALAKYGFATPAGICSTSSGDTSEPDFSKNPNVKVDGSPAGGHKPSNCTGTFTAGASSLREIILNRWSPPVTSIGGYHCRQIVGGSSTSVHGLGRALDIMIDSTTPEGLAKGDEIRNWLINNSTSLGIQRVIWNQHTWAANIDGWRKYTGSNPHIDHLHVEVNIEASKNSNLGR